MPCSIQACTSGFLYDAHLLNIVHEYKPFPLYIIINVTFWLPRFGSWIQAAKYHLESEHGLRKNIQLISN